VWKVLREHFKDTHSFVIQRLAAISAQGLVKENSSLQARTKCRKMIESKWGNIDFVVFQIGSVDLEFVLPYKRARLISRGDSSVGDFDVDQQISESLCGLKEFAEFIQVLKPNDQLMPSQIVFVGVHPPVVEDQFYRECLNKNRKGGKEKKVIEEKEEVVFPESLDLPNLFDRTEIYRSFNRELQNMCIENGYHYVSIFEECIDPSTGIVCEDLKRKGTTTDVHLNELHPNISRFYLEKLSFLL
jgi:hypothetical protein